MATTVLEQEKTLDYREISMQGAKAEVYSEGFDVNKVIIISGTWINNGNGGTFTPDPTFDPITYDVAGDYNLNLLVQVLEEVKRAEINQETGKAFSLHYTASDYGYIAGETLQAVRYGSDGTPVSATPMSNYHFTEWSDGDIVNPRIDQSVTADVNVYAKFEINTYTLSYLSTSNGLISGDAIQTITVNNNGVTVIAVPNEDYLFANWSDGVLDNPRTDLNVQADVNAIANYILKSFNASYVAGDNGSLTGDTSQDIQIHMNGTPVVAVPDADYRFDNWSDGSEANPRTDGNVTGDIGVVAAFVPDGFELLYVEGANGTITGTKYQIVKDGNDGTEVVAVADTNYVFYGWSDSNYSIARTDLAVSDDITVSAEFVVGDYIVYYTATEGGRVDGDYRQAIVSGADAATVTAVAITGYVFDQWANGSFVAERTDTVIVADLEQEATFQIGDHVLNYTAGDDGTLSGDARQFVINTGSGIAIQALPDVGFVFDSWSDGVLTAIRTDIGVTNSIDVTATFVAE